MISRNFPFWELRFSASARTCITIAEHEVKHLVGERRSMYKTSNK